jgi:DNA-binding NarL/FixJ family response regulator
MSSIRVLVANRPRLIRELLMATISDQTDIEIVGEIPEEADIVGAVEESRPDFVIIALDKSKRLPPFCISILQDHPEIKVIAISPNTNNFVCYYTALQVQSYPIEASEAGVLNALRGKTQPIERVQ